MSGSTGGGSVGAMADSPTSYWDYIKVEQLLGLQTGLQTTEENLANDEVMFIVIHQIDELWFKLGIRELVGARDLFARERVEEQALSSAVRGIRRAALLFKQAAAHFPLMETLTTRDYLAFRDKLYPASGFQSAQMREIEFLMGLEESDRIALGSESYLQAPPEPRWDRVAGLAPGGRAHEGSALVARGAGRVVVPYPHRRARPPIWMATRSGWLVSSTTTVRRRPGRSRRPAPSPKNTR